MSNTDFYKLWHKDLLTDMKEKRANAWSAFQSLKNKNTKYAQDIRKMHDIYQILVTEIINKGE